MRWTDVDLADRVWTVPRTKNGRPHRVPLSPPAVAVLERMQALRDDSNVVFPSRRRGGKLGHMSLREVLVKLVHADVTVHGFRCTFRDWAAELTAHPAEVVEMALAHTIGNKVEAAYRRGDLFDKRRALMAAWATFAAGQDDGVVVPLRA
jgi:integrase